MQLLRSKFEGAIRRIKFFWNTKILGISIKHPPTFIVACGHSGTSVLLAALGTHSKIYAVPKESGIATTGNKGWFESSMREFDVETLRAGKHRWIEKTPAHIRHLDDIFKWEPKAKVILIVRDGRDVVVSIKKRTGILADGINLWLDDNTQGKPFWNHPNVHVVKYENFVSDFESFMKDVLDFLGEKFEPKIKDFHKVPKKWYSTTIEKPNTAKGKGHNQLRNWQINQPLFDGRGRWKDLAAEELAIVEEQLGPMLIELDYPASISEKG